MPAAGSPEGPVVVEWVRRRRADRQRQRQQPVVVADRRSQRRGYRGCYYWRDFAWKAASYFAAGMVGVL